MEQIHPTAHTRYRFFLKRAALLRWLAKRNLSQNAFARRCGLSSGFMSQLLSGQRHAGPATRQRIMDAFPATDFDQLFEEVEVGD